LQNQQVRSAPTLRTGGFLVNALEHIRKNYVKSDADRKVLQTSIRGIEKKPLPHLLATTNLILHDVEIPQIKHDNALTFRPYKDYDEADQVDVILTNPPFGGEEESKILNNFPTDKQTKETALLFLQLIMRKLHRSPRKGRAAVVVPNGILFGDGIAARIKEELLREFNLHTVVRLPNGVFAPYTSIPTNLLFFEVGGPTRNIWYYEQTLPEGVKNYTKTKPIQAEEFTDCLSWWHQRVENERAWCVPAEQVAANNFNLDLKNPNRKEDLEHLPPAELAESILAKEKQIAAIMDEIRSLLVKRG
jgi:type I restriction enzyme M protein